MSTTSTKLIFDDEHKFVTSYLVSPRTLGFVRLSFGFYTLVTNIFSIIWDGVNLGTADAYFSYFTHLSYIGITAWFFASGFQTLALTPSAKPSKHVRYPLQSWPRPLQFLHELLFSTIATFSIVVAIVYWGLLASSESFSSAYKAWSTISQHILNVLFVLFEILCTNVPPPRCIHFPITLLILGLYLGVAYITRATQGFYAYSFLDPKKQGAFLAVYIAGIAVCQAVVFCIAHYTIVLREHLVRRSSHV